MSLVEDRAGLADAEPEVDRGLHLYLDGGRLALRRRSHRPIFAKGRRLVDEGRNARWACRRCIDDGDLASREAGKPDALLHHSDRGSPIYERAVPAPDGRQWRRLLDEPIRQCLGQCGDGELLLFTEDRADREETLPHARRCSGGRLRFRRAVLQSRP
jgi:hypothetical protein